MFTISPLGGRGGTETPKHTPQVPVQGCRGGAKHRDVRLRLVSFCLFDFMTYEICACLFEWDTFAALSQALATVPQAIHGFAQRNV